jgi:hypothetical protein
MIVTTLFTTLIPLVSRDFIEMCQVGNVYVLECQVADGVSEKGVL